MDCYVLRRWDYGVDDDGFRGYPHIFCWRFYLERRLSATKLPRPYRICIEYNYPFLMTSVVPNPSVTFPTSPTHRLMHNRRLCITTPRRHNGCHLHQLGQFPTYLRLSRLQFPRGVFPFGRKVVNPPRHNTNRPPSPSHNLINATHRSRTKAHWLQHSYGATDSPTGIRNGADSNTPGINSLLRSHFPIRSLAWFETQTGTGRRTAPTASYEVLLGYRRPNY